VLKKGGTFICKVFRSKDYNSFLYVLNSLFTKVESSKPPSSRSQSAEIFMVCLGYKAPDYIDPKFLDPKHVFEDIENSKGGVDGNALEAKGTEGMSLK
jgi:AdoMet-dependent rRNA methyltransferase SPB1